MSLQYRHDKIKQLEFDCIYMGLAVTLHGSKVWVQYKTHKGYEYLVLFWTVHITTNERTFGNIVFSLFPPTFAGTSMSQLSHLWLLDIW